MRQTFVRGAVAVAFAAVWSLSLSAGMAGQKGSTVPEVAGKWVLTIGAADEAVATELVLEQAGAEVKGSLSGLHGMTLSVEGRWSEGTLGFSALAHADHGELSLDFTGTLEKDGTLKGSMSSPMGERPWRAERAR